MNETMSETMSNGEVEEMARNIRAGLSDVTTDLIDDYSGEAYICDAISNCADDSIDIYNYDLKNWAASDKADACIAEAISEGLVDTSNDFSLMRLYQTGEYLDNEHTMYDELSDAVKVYALEYAASEHESMTRGNVLDILDAVELIDSNDGFDDIRDAVNEQFQDED